MSERDKILRFLTIVTVLLLAIDLSGVRQMYYDDSTAFPSAANQTNTTNDTSSNTSYSAVNVSDNLSNGSNITEGPAGNYSEPLYVNLKSQVPHIVHFWYDSKSGTKGRFEAMQTELTSKYPFITVSGAEFPLPKLQLGLSWAISTIQYLLIFFMLGGQAVFAKLGMPPPPIYLKLKEKQMMVVMAIFLLGNTLVTSVSRTGAFEVELDGQLIYSGIQSGLNITSRELEEKIIGIINQA